MLPKSDARKVLERAKQDPAWWMRTVLGRELWPRQVDIAHEVRDKAEIAVASCHGAGKSFTAAGIGLWFACTHYPAIVITTAPTDRQVRGILWKEIRLAHKRALFPLGGKLLSQELKWDDNWWMLGFTAPDYDPDRFQGFHEENVLVIVDEAAGVTQPIFDGIGGILSSDNAKLLMIGNPTDPGGRFGQSFKRSSVGRIRISAFDTPNFTKFGITQEDIETGAWQRKVTGPLPMPKLVSPRWAAQRWEEWGRTKESPLYQARVLGEFPTAGADQLIPLNWILAAQERDLPPPERTPVELGVDVARYGDDESVIVKREVNRIRVVWSGHKQGTMETTGHVVNQMTETGARLARVDVVGVGAGVVDRLRELHKTVVEVNAGAASTEPERFANARAEWWWNVRKRFEEGRVDIDPADEILAGQLASLRYKIDSKGRIVIESKEDAKKRGAPSPDRADALMHAFADVDTGEWLAGMMRG